MKLISACIIFFCSTFVATKAQSSNDHAIKLARCVADQLYLAKHHTEPMVHIPARGVAQDYSWCANKLMPGRQADLTIAATEKMRELEKMHNEKGVLKTLNIALTSSEKCAEICWPIMREHGK